MAKVVVAASLLLTATILSAIPVAGAPLPNHAGCFYWGWSTTQHLDIPTPVADVATYVDISSVGHPAPYDTMKCDNPQGPSTTHWTSWADSCAGVPDNTAVMGAWCGPAVGSTMSCIISAGQPTIPPQPGNQFTIGFDVNWDGLVNEFDSSTGTEAPLSTEPLGAGGLPIMALSDPAMFGQVPFPVGARMIAFPMASSTYGMTVPANFAINCA